MYNCCHIRKNPKHQGDLDIEKGPSLLITYWKSKEQMFFESMHCLFCDNHQQTTPITTEDRRQAPPPWHQKGEQGRSNQNKRRHLPSPKRKKATSPQQNNKEEQKEEEKQDEDSNTATTTGTTNVEDLDSSKEKGSSVVDRDIVRYWYYLAHMLKSAVWHKSMDRRKFNL
jgi:hypothetical protein